MEQKLVELDASRCLLTDAALVELATKCLKLEKLDLTRCEAIGDIGVVEFVRHAPALREFIIAQCSITDASID